MITIKELAEQCGVSKVSIMKRIDKCGLREQLVQDGNRLLVPQTVADKITEIFGFTDTINSNRHSDTKTQNKSLKNENIGLYEALLKQLEVKDKQIADLTEANKDLAEMNRALTVTIQQNNALQHETNMLLGSGNAEPPQEVPHKKHWWNK